jgi:hypothetical protein
MINWLVYKSNRKNELKRLDTQGYYWRDVVWILNSHLRVDTKNLGTLRACKLLECGIIMSQYHIVKNDHHFKGSTNNGEQVNLQ